MASVSNPVQLQEIRPAVLVARPSHGKWLKLAGAAIVLAAVIGTYLFYTHQSAAPNYVTAKVDRGDIDATVTTTGNLNAVITVQVGSQVSGNIIALYADFNTKVKKGQLVAEIDPAPFKAAVEQATASVNAAKAAVITATASVAKSQADLATARANVANQKANVVKAQSVVALAKLENDREQELLESKTVAQQDADTARANYEQALASVDAAQAAVNAAQASADSAQKGIDVAMNQLDQAKALAAQSEAALAQAQLNLDHTKIVAPVDGTVESRNMDVGQTVAASFQAPVIFLIAQDLTKMQVDTNVDESDMGPIRLNQSATFTVDAYPGQVFHGTVAQIRQAPINVQNVITYDVVIAVSNPDLKLFPGMTANATISTGHVSNALRIPKAALRFRPRTVKQPTTQKATNTQTVYILDQHGQPAALQVKTGLSDANHVESTGGELVEGQQLITGMPVKAGTSETAPPQATGGSTKKFGF